MPIQRLMAAARMTAPIPAAARMRRLLWTAIQGIPLAATTMGFIRESALRFGAARKDGCVVSDGYVTWVKSGNHRHSINIPSHTHAFSIPSHSHSFSIPSHRHSFNIPSHTHEITQGIYEGTTANKVSIKVDGKAVPVSGNEINIAPYLSTGDGGKILRDTWHEIEITPDKMTRIIVNVFIQLFVNSRGEGDY